MITALIPVYNEQEAIGETVTTLDDVLKAYGEEYEILVINDGSTDDTVSILNTLNIPAMHVIDHHRNRGYGSCMKTGIRKARGNLFVITDADGTYPIKDFPEHLDIMKEREADMIIGARTKKGVQIPLIRRPAKAVVNKLADFLTGMKIPDLNSGMRIFTRELGEHFMHLYPERFSFTITITLAALTSNYSVEFVPIDYFKRKGSSSLSAGFNGIKNFVNFLGIIIRITTYFKPLRFFGWPSTLLILAGLATMIFTISTEKNVSDAGLLIFFTGIQIGLFGLLAEAIALEHKRKR